MKRRTIVTIALAVGLLTGRCTVAGDEKPSNPNNPVAVIKTSMGTIEAELFKDKAPISTQNFVDYTKDKHYDGTVFHRVIPNFMIQGGGFTPDMKQKGTKTPIKNEAGNGQKNLRGTLAMARTPVVDSATSQFFINLRENDFLDHKGQTSQTFGYAVFGKVLKGMDVVDKIAAVDTTTKGMHEDVPSTAVVIESVQIREAAK